MIRNIVLAVSSLAALIILFVGYTVLVGVPTGERGAPRAMQELPPQEQATTRPLRVGEILEVPAGGKIIFRRYDERTGRPRDMFICQDWQPVPGSKNEIRVTGPELTMLLPSGMIATVSADEGQVVVDRVEQAQMRPKLGWLAGNVRIVVDRETRLDRTPGADRPADLITFAASRLEFDLELGELKTADRITIHSEDFELAGTGLHLIWNQAANRIETLSLAQGEELVLYAAAGMFGMQEEAGAAQAEAATATTQAAAEKPRRRKRPAHPPTAYACTLTGGLVAEQYRGDERIGGLDADDLRLLFDAGGADRFLRPGPAATTPTSRPTREERQRLVLRWSGPLQLGPAPAASPDGPNRRRLEATGRPVVMTRGDGVVRCGRVAYHDDGRRVWLYPTAGGTVEVGMGQSMSATAQSVYIDRAARVVKLVGDVELRSRRGSGQNARLSSIRCTYWAELYIAKSQAATRPPQTDTLVDVERLESATFVGDVQVNLGEQKLTGQRLDVAFRPDTGGQSLEELLDTATASGDVVLTSGDGRLQSAELELAFAMTPDQTLYPRRMDAAGAVLVARKRASIRGDRVCADLAPPQPEELARPSEKEADRPTFVIRKLDVRGKAELVDPDNKIAARGREITAAFEGLNRLTTATVSGAADGFGLVHARPYTVRGARIDLDRGAQTIHVDGPSQLSFTSQRSLQGDERGKPRPVLVRSTRLLHVDGRRNAVRFEGQVVACTEDEELRGDTLTLLMEDVKEPAPAELEQAWPGLCRALGGNIVNLSGVPTDASWRGLWRKARGVVGSREKPPSPDDLFALRVAGESERMRKEPVRLVSDNALVSSETYEPGDDAPIVHASISAPWLEVDIANRQIFTTGLTDLLMTDRRGWQDAEPVRDAVGLPSALISRGPNQTAIRCEGRMTYTLGPDGPGRRDTVVFEDRVLFVHRTGKEMVNLAQMLPQAAANPELLETLKSRNAALSCDRLECWFAVDRADQGARRGGALTRAPLRLAALIATGSVYLRDQEDTRVREVNAAWVEFHREQGRIHVRGADRADARVYFEDTKTGQFDVHAGAQLVINMQDGTVRSDRIEGEMRRRSK